MEMSDMGRDTQLIYLRDVCHLETLKSALNSRYQSEKQSFEAKKKELLTPQTMAQPKKKNNGCLIAAVLYIAFAVIILIGGMVLGEFFEGILATGHERALSEIIGEIVFCSAIVAALVLIIRRRTSDSKKECLRVEEHNKRERERMAHNSLYVEEHVEKPWKARSTALADAYQETSSLLNENYSLNLIPMQFRNLSSVQYIYDFMSTSQLSFEQAVYQAQIDDGIRRIESRLNIIVQQNEVQIRQLYAIRENAKRIISQNQLILAAQVASAYYNRQTELHTKNVERVFKDIHLL